MAKVLLSEDGVFPIVRDKDGNLLKDLPETGINIAGTIQGEGKLVGMPSLFIRFAGCNLRCEWHLADGSKSICDTSYASFDLSTARNESVDDVLRLVENNLGNIRHVVITGGEPFLQPEALKELCKGLKSIDDIYITIESNGTIYDDSIAEYVDLFSISPKLAYSLGGKSFEGLEKTVQKFIDFVCQGEGKDIQLKFVASCKEHEDDIKDFLDKLKGWIATDILVMPAGETQDVLDKTSKLVLDMCIRNAWRFCSRLHVTLFGGKKGI